MEVWTIVRRSPALFKKTGKELRCNDQIRISPIRLIDEQDQQAGVVDLEEGRRRARDADLDLVEVAPQASPPVCRVMDYGKWKYQQRKKEQKSRGHSKQSELKEVRLRPKIDDHDLLFKMGRAREFLQATNKVQFTMLFRGREMAHRDLGLKIMHGIRDGMVDIANVEIEPRQQGRRMTMVLAPDRKPKGANKVETSEPSSTVSRPVTPANANAPDAT